LFWEARCEKKKKGKGERKESRPSVGPRLKGKGNKKYPIKTDEPEMGEEGKKRRTR